MIPFDDDTERRRKSDTMAGTVAFCTVCVCLTIIICTLLSR